MAAHPPRGCGRVVQGAKRTPDQFPTKARPEQRQVVRDDRGPLWAWHISSFTSSMNVLRKCFLMMTLSLFENNGVTVNGRNRRVKTKRKIEREIHIQEKCACSLNLINKTLMLKNIFDVETKRRSIKAHFTLG